MSEWNQIAEHYISMEKQRWHFLKYPKDIIDSIYDLTEPENDNQICAVFDDTHHFNRMISLTSLETISTNQYINDIHYSYVCRYIRIGNVTYDLFKPSNILNIPIPEINFDITNAGIPHKFLEEQGYLKEYEFEDSDYLLDLWNDDDVWDKIESILKVEGKDAAIKEAYNQVYKTCEDHNITLSNELIDQEVNELIELMEKPTPSLPEVLSTTAEDVEIEEDDYDKNDLIDFFNHRIKDCFEPALVVPLCHIAINLQISSRISYGLERLVAQVAAVGEVDYARYLEQELSKMSRTWNKDKALSYGLELREWAINSKEYKWLCDNYPDETPKSKGAYTSAKRKKTKRYIKLKEMAAEKNYDLIDDVEAYLRQ